MNKKYLVLLIIAISNCVSLQAAVTETPAINTVAIVVKFRDNNQCLAIVDGVVHRFELPEGVPLRVINALEEVEKVPVMICETQEDAERWIKILQSGYKVHQFNLSLQNRAR